MSCLSAVETAVGMESGSIPVTTESAESPASHGSSASDRNERSSNAETAVEGISSAPQDNDEVISEATDPQYNFANKKGHFAIEES